MKDLITFLDKNVKSAVYTGGYIHGIYLYLEISVAPKTLTTQVSALIIFVLDIPLKMIQKLNRNFFQISA